MKLSILITKSVETTTNLYKLDIVLTQMLTVCRTRKLST